jgi:hypothetical protein
MISLVPRFEPNVFRERSRIFNFSVLLNSVLLKKKIDLCGSSTYKHNFQVFTAVNTHVMVVWLTLSCKLVSEH